jgi:uncharacterized membrane protein
MNNADDVNKVPASAGAQWLLDGLANLRKAPLALGTLGLIYGAIALVVGQAAAINTGLFMALEVLLVLLGPLLMGGFVFAARSVAAGGPAVPAQLLEGMQGGRTGRLLATLLPNIAALVVCVALLFAMVGADALLQIAQAVERASAQATPDPSVFEGLPVGSLFLWFLLVIVIGIAASFFTFVAIPEIMFRPAGAFAAMGRSFRACVRNLPALLVFLVLTFIAIVVLYIGLSIVGAIVGAIAGKAAMQVVLQLLGSALVMPTLMSAIYFAWRQMLSGEQAVAAPSNVAGFEA